MSATLTASQPPAELFSTEQPLDGLLFWSSYDDPEPQAKKKDQSADEGEQKLKEFMTTVEKVSVEIRKQSAEPPTICEVPGDLTEGNKRAYNPKVVCIGPFFDSKRKTAGMLRLEKFKWYCVSKLIVGRQPAGTSELAAWSPEVHAPLVRKCFELMMSLAPQVRASYSRISSSKHTSNEQLAINMLLDGCFILHLLKYAAGMAERSSGDGNGGNNDDDWIGQNWVWGAVKRDLLVLSNQVPFFVLRKLFQNLGSEREDIIVNGGLQLFSSLHPRRLHSTPIACDTVHHLLHLFYLSIDLPPSSSTDHVLSTRQHAALPPDITWWAPSAKELHAAGVLIRPRKDGPTSFLDVRFRWRRGVLEIPPLELYDYSEPLFRNLIAFEQTYLATPGHITTYAIFMDCLLKTTEDVRLIHRSGVLVNRMNGKRKYAALGFFGRLCAEARTSAKRNHLTDVMDEVVKYQRGRWPQWRAALVTNPWVTTSLVASAILLALTVLQSYYTVIAYYKPIK